MTFLGSGVVSYAMAHLLTALSVPTEEGTCMNSTTRHNTNSHLLSVPSAAGWQLHGQHEGQPPQHKLQCHSDPPILVSLISVSPVHAMGCSSQVSSDMNVCELFAGIAVMSAVLQSIGCNVSMLCESNVTLSNLLKLRFPMLDVEDKPWLQWAKDGQTALATVDGVPCQPFSPMGQMRMHEDSRAFMALHVCDATVGFSPPSSSSIRSLTLLTSTTHIAFALSSKNITVKRASHWHTC